MHVSTTFNVDNCPFQVCQAFDCPMWILMDYVVHVNLMLAAVALPVKHCRRFDSRSGYVFLFRLYNVIIPGWNIITWATTSSKFRCFALGIIVVKATEYCHWFGSQCANWRCKRVNSKTITTHFVFTQRVHVTASQNTSIETQQEDLPHTERREVSHVQKNEWWVLSVELKRGRNSTAQIAGEREFQTFLGWWWWGGTEIISQRGWFFVFCMWRWAKGMCAPSCSERVVHWHHHEGDACMGMERARHMDCYWMHTVTKYKLLLNIDCYTLRVYLQ